MSGIPCSKGVVGILKNWVPNKGAFRITKGLWRTQYFKFPNNLLAFWVSGFRFRACWGLEDF